ncbi:MAG: hypothetical protein B6I24_02320 [Bacteroidetes bacterium 4572_128]|nr:MAG: hypothetical protein B6I24_02320 [Bacteroidetes bacterium 4572_128]
MKIVILGAGNLATHLAKNLSFQKNEILQIYSRTKKSAKILANFLKTDFTNDLNKICKNADLYIFSLKDEFIKDILEKINLRNKFFVHTAGSLGINIFQNYTKNFGVFYPLQTFSKNTYIDFKNVPICLEANNEKNLKILENLAKKISYRIFFINSKKREVLHLSATFSCNFVNHFYAISNEILKKNNIPFDILRPLIFETSKKIEKNLPLKVQTGPAIRNDKNIIKKHKEKLNFYSSNWNKIYNFVSDDICKLQNKNMSFNKEYLKKIKAFAFDVDGVFTSNVMLYVDGDMLRSMNTKDGYAVQYAIKKGFPIAIITGGNSKSVEMRFKKLGLTDIYLASHHKLTDFEDFLSKYELSPDEVLYMGDDIPDYEIMKIVGMPTCPSDASEEIIKISKYISDKKGGETCVRDVIEQVLRSQNKWLKEEAFSW